MGRSRGGVACRISGNDTTKEEMAEAELAADVQFEKEEAQKKTRLLSISINFPPTHGPLKCHLERRPLPDILDSRIGPTNRRKGGSGGGRSHAMLKPGGAEKTTLAWRGRRNKLSFFSLGIATRPHLDRAKDTLALRQTQKNGMKRHFLVRS